MVTCSLPTKGRVEITLVVCVKHTLIKLLSSSIPVAALFSHSPHGAQPSPLGYDGNYDLYADGGIEEVSTPIERLESLLADVADVATDLDEGPVTGLSIDFQASGEHPYRLHLPDDPLPIPGVVRIPSQPGSSGASTAPEPDEKPDEV